MIGKIKELVNVKEDIANLSKEFSALKKEVGSFSKELETLKRSIKDSSSKQEDFLGELGNNISLIEESKDAFKKEVYDFKLLKQQIQGKLVHKFEEELEKELKVNVGKLKEDYGGYAELKEKVESVKPKIDELNDAVHKLAEITKSIKKEDFELTKHMADIKKADHEKLELMKKIDSLERLISKMRRNKR